MVKSHAKLLRKYLADNAKVAAIIEIGMYMQLDLYSLKRQEQVITGLTLAYKCRLLFSGRAATVLCR